MRAINVPSDRRYLECVQNVCFLAFASSAEADQYDDLKVLTSAKPVRKVLAEDRPSAACRALPAWSFLSRCWLSHQDRDQSFAPVSSMLLCALPALFLTGVSAFPRDCCCYLSPRSMSPLITCSRLSQFVLVRAIIAGVVWPACGGAVQYWCKGQAHVLVAVSEWLPRQDGMSERASFPVAYHS
jgi:hypothetical protein